MLRSSGHHYRGYCRCCRHSNLYSSPDLPEKKVAFREVCVLFFWVYIQFVVCLQRNRFSLLKLDVKSHKRLQYLEIYLGNKEIQKKLFVSIFLFGMFIFCSLCFFFQLKFNPTFCIFIWNRSFHFLEYTQTRDCIKNWTKCDDAQIFESLERWSKAYEFLARFPWFLLSFFFDLSVFSDA